MNDYLQQISAMARQAISRKEWPTVGSCAAEILKNDEDSAEGHFLTGMFAVASQRPEEAATSFDRALSIDEKRYDAAVELARLHAGMRRNGEAVALLDRYVDLLQGSPVYLMLAAEIYRQVGILDKPWQLYGRANEVQPGVASIKSGLAAAAVAHGRTEEARVIYEELLSQNPNHQRNHLTYGRLQKATNRDHIDQMKDVLASAKLKPSQNVFLYYAIGKELEDLEDWPEAFEYFKTAGDAVSSVSKYDINSDIELTDKIIEVCNADWLQKDPADANSDPEAKQPIFVMGLPRTGTTLTEQILASHSKVLGVGETQFIQMTILRESGAPMSSKISAEMIDLTANVDSELIRKAYMDMLEYRLGDEPMFVDKTPFNIFYLGYIMKAFPNARIIIMKRNPMDSCFSMYKQVFSWAFKFSYSLENLGKFYVAYDRLIKHWKETLGDRLIELEYDKLVADQEVETRRLLYNLGLEFESACLDFHKNESASATVSSVQIRQKMYTDSVHRWKNYESELQPLRDYLEKAGISVE